MSETVVLLRDDGGAPLIVDGAVRVAQSNPGYVTQNVVPDRASIADGVLVYPIRVGLEAIVSPDPAADNVTTGDARIQEVRTWLEQARADAVTLSLQVPGDPIVTDLVIESYTTQRGVSNAIQMSVELVEVRIATEQAVGLAQVTRAKEPTDAAAADLAKKEDKGRRGKRSILAAGIEDGLRALTGGN